MWTVEQLVGLGLYLGSSEFDVPENVEIRLLPRVAVVGGRVRLHRIDPVLANMDQPARVVESDIVEACVIGHPRIASEMTIAYSHVLNVLAIILDG